ncbi:MAG: hypothetical protein GXP16_12400 [Gammaproteobacteria bacterium]|nr:hypothetical protein [Gammaproteobacteria bacterium]
MPDIDVVGSYGFGGFVNALLASFNVPQPEPFIDAMAETMLRVFGIADEEARVIAHLPLPDEWVRAEFKD